MHREESELQQLVALGSEGGVLLDEALDELLGLGREVNRVVYFIFVDLHNRNHTFSIFYMMMFRLSPSKGTLPVSSS